MTWSDLSGVSSIYPRLGSIKKSSGLLHQPLSNIALTVVSLFVSQILKKFGKSNSRRKWNSHYCTLFICIIFMRLKILARNWLEMLTLQESMSDWCECMCVYRGGGYRAYYYTTTIPHIIYASPSSQTSHHPPPTHLHLYKWSF